MGAANRRRRRKANRAHEARQAAYAADRAIAAAEQADAALAPVCPITDVSDLKISVQDLEAAGTESEVLTWFVARCEPGAERRALDGLRERRICAYLPVEKRWQWVRGRKRLIERPLFVGYLFVGIAMPRQSLYAVKRVSGIEGAVEVAGVPRAVDAWAVVQIAAAELSGLFDHTGPKRPVYAKDQKVKVVSGQFAGFIAKVVEAKGDRLRILFEAGLFKGSPFPVDDVQVSAVDDREAA